MNYQQIYNNITERAKSRGKIDGYAEKHHILPRSLGGTDDLDNLVELTAKEHFVVHHLLTKMYNGEEKRKMLFAFHCMMYRKTDTMKRYKVPARLYEYYRTHFAEAQSQKTMTLEQRKAVGDFHRGRKRSEETCKRISEALKAAGPAGGAVKGSTRKSSTRESISKARKGIEFSDEHRHKLSEAKKGKVPWNKGISSNKGPKPKLTCPHCGLEGGRPQMKRWHFDNCRQK